MNKLVKKKKEKKASKSGFADALARVFGNLLGGGFLSNSKALRQMPFVFFLVFLAVIYIANSYYAEKNIRNIERLQKELKELRFEYITSKSELMQNSRQSAIARSLEKTGIKETTEPPEKINSQNQQEN